MRRWLMRLTDSNTFLGNAVLCGLFLAVLIIWGCVLSGCALDDHGLALVADDARVRTGHSGEETGPGPDTTPPALPDAGPALAVDTAPALPPADTAPAPPPPDAMAPTDTVPTPPPADAAPAGVYGTPYPRCSSRVRALDCYGNGETGRCRTPDGFVCVVCNVTEPCAFFDEMGGATRTEGPSCNLGRVCFPVACPITAGPACTQPHQP